MTTKRDPNAIIATWLDDGPLELPGSTRRAIATSLRTTEQRRGFSVPWRTPHMTTSLRLILAVAALALAVGGIYLFSGVGAPPVAPGPSLAPATPLPASVPPASAAASSPSPSRAPTAADLGLTGRIVFNRYDTQASMYGTGLGLFVANADGTGERAITPAIQPDGAVFSPDGTRLLLANGRPAGKDRPGIVNVDGSGFRRLETPGSFGDMFCAAWSPDGARLLCTLGSGQKGVEGGIYSIRSTDGGGLTKLNGGAPPSVEGTVSGCGGGDFIGDVSPDGTRYVFYRNWCGPKPDPVATENAGLWIGDTTGRSAPVEVLKTPAVNPHEAGPRWSPDGQWIAFGTYANTIALVRPDGTDKHTVDVAVTGDYYAYSPDWSPDGQWLMFTLWTARSQRSDLYVVRPDGSELTKVVAGEGTEDIVSWGVAAP